MSTSKVSASRPAERSKPADLQQEQRYRAGSRRRRLDDTRVVQTKPVGGARKSNAAKARTGRTLVFAGKVLSATKIEPQHPAKKRARSLIRSSVRKDGSAR